MLRLILLSTRGSRPRSPWVSTTSGYEPSSHPPSPAGRARVNPLVGVAADRGPRLALSVAHMRPSYSAPEAPTHLRAGALPPNLIDHMDRGHLARGHLDRDAHDPIKSGKRDRAGASHGGSHHSASASRTRRRPEPAPLPAIPDVDDHSIVSA